MDDEDDDELVQVSNMVPESIRDAASENTDFGGVSEAVRETYRILANNGSVERVRLEMQLRKIRNDKERIQNEIAELEEQLEHLNEREERLEARTSEAATRREEYEELLDEMDALLQDGERVFEDHGKVKRAADLSDQTPEEVVDELRDRNPDVDEYLFTSGLEADTWRDTR